ncbi:Acyl-CoA dehydrogenase [Clostridium cavendishii DSM 21758]|uniref:Acyl-CoA dehydrogenase n=1 Tax=Clostridium cavendishii DSM 21758 TaxID=1121302 RepID=A0A1M6MTN2_9CLOT|nr:acyl-CoA dehydrogenase family protein [Clostridium cavendishii]SHJ86766.1 Acyl-CoA dehydrogenase [Clostridium cavendishii DSM 21758]
MYNLLNTEYQAYYDEFSIFVQENILPYTNEWEKNQSIPKDIITLCSEKKYLGCCMPEIYGGNNWDIMTYGIFTKIVAEASTSLAGLFNVHTMVLQTIYKWGTEEQKEKWLNKMCAGEILGALALTEPEAGSDVQGITTSFRRENNGYVINGTKRWITFGASADVILVFGKTDDNGQSIACLVPRDTEGLKVTQIDDMLGFRASNLAVLEFQNCYVPSENLVAKENMALQCVAPYALNYGRVSVTFTALGILEGCLKESCKYASNRVTFKQRLIKQSVIEEMITQMGTDYEAASRLCLSICNNDNIATLIQEVMIIKYFVSKVACKHSANAVQILGASGCIGTSPVSRYYRDSKILEIIEGSNQIHEMILTNYFTKKYKK